MELGFNNFYFCFCIIYILNSVDIECYNIDVQYPILYSGKLYVESEKRNSYFGYSVILHKDWIQVGAPRANSSVLKEVEEPGVVYRCPIKGPCTELILDINQNTRIETGYWPLKDRAWTGVTMDYEEGESVTSRLVVCSHRWKNQYSFMADTKNEEGYEINGICYWIDTTSMMDNRSNILKPTLDPSKKQLRTLHYYAHSQVGMSLHLFPQSRRERGLMLGAPGILNWRGSVAQYKSVPVISETSRSRRSTTDSEKYEVFSNLTVLEVVNLQSYVSQFDLLGYQVSSGCFFRTEKERCPFVAGAPRGYNLHGYVLIYNLDPANGQRISVMQQIYGHKIGEYFGSSLTVADITGDNLDDLIVGAPTYSKDGDEGRIYVYFGSISGKLVEQSNNEFIGKNIGDRFGTSLASLGDIDKDGCDDIAVGVPYEGSGVVYIYNGSPVGLTQYSQKIVGKDIYENIRGFGISIGRPTDIDNNNYRDLAIGSYLSGHAVIVRTFPVISIYGQIYPAQWKLKLTDEVLALRICIHFVGKDAPEQIRVLRTLIIDENYKRVNNTSEEKIVTLLHNISECENLTFHLNNGENPEDLRIKLSQKLIDTRTTTKVQIIWSNGSHPEDVDKFCKFCPVVKKSTGQDFVLPYVRECGADGICKSDLHVQCSLAHETDLTGNISEFKIGSTDKIHLTVNVSNIGSDIAYSSEVQINLPQVVGLVQMPSDCQENRINNFLYITCKLRIIKKGNQKSVSIPLDTKSGIQELFAMSQRNEHVSFYVNSNSSSEEQNAADNQCYIHLMPIVEADVHLTGKLETDTRTFKMISEESNEPNIAFSHTYEVEKVGVSPLSTLNLIFEVPIIWQGSSEPIEFLDLLKTEAFQDNEPLYCNSNFNTRTKRDVGVKSSIRDRSVVEDYDKTENSSVVVLLPSSNVTFYLNCSTPDVKCTTVSCEIKHFMKKRNIKVSINMELNINKLEKVMGEKNSIYFSSQGHVKILDFQHRPPPPQEEWRHDAIISSHFVGIRESEKLQIWIIVVCIIVGLLLVLLIVFGLIKAGFFQRKMKDELQALKEADGNAK